MKAKMASVLAAAMTIVAAAGPAVAQDNRQRDKNTMRNLGTGLGAAAVVEALRGKGTHAILLGAGAAYSAKKYEDARKAQSRENNTNRRRYYRVQRSQPVRVLLNDKRVAFADEGPEMVAGNVYVPLRGVLEEMGAYVRWDPQAQSVVAVHESREVRLPIGGTATVNGKPVALDAPAYIAEGRTMVPLRFMAEAFGANVNWNAGAREVRIRS